MLGSMKSMSLDRILQSQGFGSRKDCRAIVEDGLVMIDGQVQDRWQSEYQPAGLVFTVAGKEWQYHEYIYLVLHKPGGYECSRRPSHHPSVLDLLPPQYQNRGVQPVGRLDHDTTGLLLLSDDGRFIHTQSSPKHHVPKLYAAELARPCTQELVDSLLAGVQLHDEPAPLRAISCRQTGPLSLELEIDQGKYHQVKRMLAAAGNHCAALCRIAIGHLRLDQLDLAPGQWRLLLDGKDPL